MKTQYGTHMIGRHMVVSSDGLKLGMKTDKQGVRFETLTQARKASKRGEAIIRCEDGIVVSVK